MAAQPSRPRPGGGLGQSSSSLSGTSPYAEPFYSADDIQVLHDIVALGEAILPALPERVRLPTNALFQAAEQVLPNHGYEPDFTPAHISRFLFRLGGIRSQGSLYDKFESLLGELGIKLAFDDSGSKDEQITEQDLSPRSASGRDSHAGSPSPVRLTVRRRGSHPEHTDRVSLLQHPSLGLGHQVRTRSVSPHLPLHSRSLLNRLRTGQNAGTNAHLRALQDAEERIPDIPPRPHARPFARDAHGNPRDETDDDTTQDPPIPTNPIRPHIVSNGKINGHGDAYADDVSQDDFTLNDDSMDDVDLPKQDLTAEDVDIGPDAVDYDSEMPENQVNHYDEVAASDDQLDLPASGLPIRLAPPSVSLAELEAKAKAFQRYRGDAPLGAFLGRWHEKMLEKQEIDDEEAEFADRCDLLESAGAAFLEWGSKATAARNRRVGTDDYASWVDRNERLASRAYTLHAMFNAVEYLKCLAKDEAERTAVARRHVLRKRLFSGWSQQHNDDQAKVKNFALSEAVEHWTSATLAVQVRNNAIDHERNTRDAQEAVGIMRSVLKGRLADFMYTYRAREEAVEKWQSKKLEADNEEEVAVFCETRMPVIAAVNNWHDALRAIVGHVSEVASEAEPELEPIDDQEESRNGQPTALESRLEQHCQRRDEEAKHQAISLMRQRAQESIVLQKYADKDSLAESVAHWDRERKLKTFVRAQQRQDQAETVKRLILAERESWYAKETRRDDLHEAVDAWDSLAKQSQQASVQEQANADMVCGYYRKADALEIWLDRVEEIDREKQRAKAVDLVRAAGPPLSSWRAKTRDEFFRNNASCRKADETFSLGESESVTASWRRVAREKYTRSMAERYRDARRAEKREKALEALGAWHQACARSYQLGALAKYHRESAEWEAAQKGVDDWHMFTGNAKVLREGADLANQEVYVDEWRDRAVDVRQNKEDAVDYDHEQSCAKAVADWERKTLELDGPKHTVTKVQQRNDQRVAQEAISAWHQQAVPDAPSYRTSIAARRSARRSTRASTSAEPPALVPLQPQPEPAFNAFDDDPLDVTDLVASTPVRRSALAPYRGAATTTPSAILPSPAERELRRTYVDRHVMFAGIEEEEEEGSGYWES
ncbi:hypothetical protein GQ53DRAFT_840885 [Thozetella sp. PMI_491]|nr:hypothetical protein GQ53DRAFT_840885 [Thozetella sp. PMI_491]